MSQNQTGCIVNDPRIPQGSCDDLTDDSRNITMGFLYDTGKLIFS